MIRVLTGLSLFIGLAIYGIIALLFTFEGPVALSLHFIRIAITVAALVLYIQEIPSVFEQVPPPRRDYFLTGINFMLLSSVCFSLWNEAGRIFAVDTSVFTGAISGLFSLFLIIGAGFALIAPDVGEKQDVPVIFSKPRTIAILIGVVVAVGLVLVAPLYRTS